MATNCYKYEALQTRFDRLVTAVKADVGVVARKAFSAKLISANNLSAAGNLTRDEDDRASALLQQILNKVEENSSNFDTFVAILKAVPVLKDLADELNKAVGECDSEEAVTRSTDYGHRDLPDPSEALRFKSVQNLQISLAKLVKIMVTQLDVMIKQKKISDEELVEFISDLFKDDEITHCTSTVHVVQVFSHLKNAELLVDYYFGFLKLKAIAENFGADNDIIAAQLEEYHYVLSGHSAVITIAKFLDEQKRQNKPISTVKRIRRGKKYYSKLKVKLGNATDKALVYIDRLWKDLDGFGLDPKDAVLDSIYRKCIIVTWLIRSSKSSEVRQKARGATVVFEQYNVQWVMIDDEYIYIAKSEDIPLLPSEGVTEEEDEPQEQGEVQPSEPEPDKPQSISDIVTQPIMQLSLWLQSQLLDLVGACKYNSLDAVRNFLETKDVNVNMRESDKHGWTPIMWAAEKGSMEIMKLLIERGADVNAEAKDNKWTSIIIASRKGDLEVVQLLLDRKARVDAQTKDHSTALTWALYEGHTEIAKLLISKDANIHNQEDNGWTPIIRASNKGLAEMVKLLCDKGAELNHQAERGWTALMAATNHNHKMVVDVLLERGADPNLRMTDTGEIALHIACYKGYTEIAISLVKAKSNTEVLNKEGLTAPMVATNRGHLDTLNALIKEGVAVDQPHKTSGSMPLESSVDVEPPSLTERFSEEMKWRWQQVQAFTKDVALRGIEIIRDFSLGEDKSGHGPRN